VGNEGRRTLFSTLTFAVIVIALLIAGGLYVRSLIAQSFAVESDLKEARALAFSNLRYMLDEETGIRGYAATHQRIFLEPYESGLKAFPAEYARLEERARALHSDAATSAVADIGAREADYIRTVAAPLLANSKQNPEPIERHGKATVDAFRIDINVIDTAVAQRERAANAHVQSAIARIGLLVGLAVIVLLGASVFYAMQQATLAARVERERKHSEEQQREAEILRAAYLTEKRIADTLQEAFVQRPLPTHPTFRFSATYVPASEEAKVGGDWYDALELPGNRVLFAIGDVTGHGIEAAVTMNRVRQALISSALLDPMPAALLERVGRELYRDKAPLVTAVAGFADSNTYEFVYATAGHPPPLLIEPGRPPRMLECGSLPLGAMAENEYRTFRIQSVPGAMLVLYTDGAVEHSRDVIEGEQILLAAAAEAARSTPGDPAMFIHNTVFAGRPVGDDVAILTIGFASEPALGMRVSAERDGNTGFSARLATPTIDPHFPVGRRRRAWLTRYFGNEAA
jgi:CHASE3 domain sensor protein